MAISPEASMNIKDTLRNLEIKRRLKHKKFYPIL